MTDETEADQIFLKKIGADQAAEIAVRSLCIKQLAINAGNLARYLSAQPRESRYIAMFVLEEEETLKIIEAVVNFRKKILTVTKVLSWLVQRILLLKEITMM